MHARHAQCARDVNNKLVDNSSISVGHSRWRLTKTYSVKVLRLLYALVVENGTY